MKSQDYAKYLMNHEHAGKIAIIAYEIHGEVKILPILEKLYSHFELISNFPDYTGYCSGCSSYLSVVFGRSAELMDLLSCSNSNEVNEEIIAELFKDLVEDSSVPLEAYSEYLLELLPPANSSFIWISMPNNG